MGFPFKLLTQSRWKNIRSALDAYAKLVERLIAENIRLKDKGQWAAFDRVLNWINTQEDTSIRKTDLYAAVMEMRPEADGPPTL